MPLDLPPFASAEDVVQILLSTIGPTVVKAVPTTLVPPVIIVERIGGHSDYITDYPEIRVRCIGATRADSATLSLQCQATIENAFNSYVTLDGGVRVQIDGTNTSASGRPETYENVDVKEFTATYDLRIRRPRTYAQIGG